MMIVGRNRSLESALRSCPCPSRLAATNLERDLLNRISLLEAIEASLDLGSQDEGLTLVENAEGASAGVQYVRITTPGRRRTNSPMEPRASNATSAGHSVGDLSEEGVRAEPASCDSAAASSTAACSGSPFALNAGLGELPTLRSWATGRMYACVWATGSAGADSTDWSRSTAGGDATSLGNDEALPSFGTSYVKAVRAYQNPHSAGADSWTTHELKQLPDVALEHFQGFAHGVLATYRWPIQCFLNLMTSRLKPKGGDRTTVNTASMYRLVCLMIAPILRGWDNLTADSHDSSKAGSASEKAATWRAAKSEIAAALGDASIAFMGDIEKFFDTIDPNILIKELAATSFPLCTLPRGGL